MTNRTAQFNEIYDYLKGLHDRLTRLENIISGNHPHIDALCGKCNTQLLRNNDPNALLTIYCLTCLRNETKGRSK